MRKFTISVALSLVATACGGGAATTTSSTTAAPAITAAPTTSIATTTTTQPAGFSVTSDDGRVTIDVPTEALDDDPGLSITSMAPEDAPAELGQLGYDQWVYRLEPEKQTFAAPVTVTMRIPIEEYFKVDGLEDGTPITTLVTTTLDGSGWELLGDLTIARDGEFVLVSGTTDHFSRLAALQEQVYVETRFLDVTPTRDLEFGIDFTWSNGVPLSAPDLGLAEFSSESGAVSATASNGLIDFVCPPDITSVTGDLQIELLLEATSDSSGQTGLTSAPRITTASSTAATIRMPGIQLVCRPTISSDGGIEITMQIDHPQGQVYIPGGDFRGGLSAIQLILAGLFPDLYAGLIQDSDGDGLIGPNDVMFPFQAGASANGATTFVLPLYSYGDYFFYLVDGAGIEVTQIETSVSVRDGATILLGGLVTEERTAVPFLGDLPFLGRVFSDESSTTENTELLVFITPRILSDSE